jgi:hypothetical protein
MSLHEPPDLTQGHNGRFGPHVKAVAKTIFLELALCPHVLEVLKQIHAEHPGLTFSDFVDAARLADLLERQRMSENAARTGALS